ncbi:MAG: alpha/beta fold hydrolase [Myxococcota bacterium]
MFTKTFGASGRMWVALHGFGGDADRFRPLADHLVAHRLWAPDLPGHRYTAWPKVGPVGAFSTVVSQIRCAVRGIDGPRWLLGYSLGGRLGLVAWSEEPSLFEGAILIGVHPGLESAHARRERAAQDDLRARDLRAKGVAAFFSEWDRLPLFGGRGPISRPEHDADSLAEALAGLSLGRMPSVRPFARASARRGRLTGVAGQHDPKFRELLGQLGPTEVAPDCHHDVVTEQPGWLARLMAATGDS